MRMVELPIVRALVVARIREIAWSPVRQAGSVVGLTFCAVGGAVVTGLISSTITSFTDVVYRVISFQLGMVLAIAASPAGRDLLVFMPDISKQSSVGFGHLMAQLPASALERLAATSLLAAPMALPYVVGMLLTGLLPHNSATSVALHLLLCFIGFAVQRAWKQLPGDSSQGWMMRQRWSLPVYGSPRDGEVSALCWAFAGQLAFAALLAPAMALVLGCLVPRSMVIDLGADNVALSLAGLASYSALMAVALYAFVLLPALAVAPVSKRSLAAAVLLLVLLSTALAGVSVLVLFILYYRSTEGVAAAAQLLMILTGFGALASTAMARVATTRNVVPVGLLIALPLMPAMMATGFIAALIPFLMPAMGVLAAVAFALALLLVFTAPRAPLSREPAGLVGAALRLMGAA